MTGPIRVVVVDDHPMFRSGLITLLSSLGGFDVVGEGATGNDAVALAATLAPDVMVLDLHMPERDGIDAAREITGADPGIGILILTMFDDDESVFAALRAGARGYVLKGAEQEEIARAIRAVAEGEAIFGAAVAQRVMRFFAGGGGARAEPFPDLTAREREILELIAQGRSNADITSRLVLSPKTVRNHVSNILGKLQVGDRSAAIVRAREAGLGQRPGAEPPR